MLHDFTMIGDYVTLQQAANSCGKDDVEIQ